MVKQTKGVAEWADHSVNIQQGCKNGCKYCYALKNALRFKRVKDYQEWVEKQTLYEKICLKGWRKSEGRFMFPTTHDIYEENYEECLIVLKKLLKAGNEVLITTKPESDIIIRLCEDLREFYDLIQFRFTITSANQKTLDLWEPNAPSLESRIHALQHAFSIGFKTSISMEPYLDEFPMVLIQDIEPYVTETIWLGTMNKRVLPPEGKELYDESLYTKEHLLNILPHCETAAKGKLRLKDSIRNLLNPPVKVKKKITSRKIKWKTLPFLNQKKDENNNESKRT